MKSKLSNDDLKNIFIENTFNGVSQSNLAKNYGVAQGTLNFNLKMYMLEAYTDSLKRYNVPLEERAKSYGLTEEQYSALIFRAKSRLMV